MITIEIGDNLASILFVAFIALVVVAVVRR